MNGFVSGGCSFSKAQPLCEAHRCGPMDPCLAPGCPHCDSSTTPGARGERRRRELMLKLERRQDVLLRRVARDTAELSKVIKKLRSMRRRDLAREEEAATKS